MTSIFDLAIIFDATADQLTVTAEAAQALRDTLALKTPKMSKAQALDRICDAFPSYVCVKDAKTVRDHLNAAYTQVVEAIDDRRIDLAREADPTPTTDDLLSIDSLLAELKSATTKAAKKAIRAKLRRRGYRLSDQRSTLEPVEVEAEAINYDLFDAQHETTLNDE